ncbi:MAG: hypothetical protein E7662_05470 [Ruminococcaceae bacterium]|nr:hypothetical protein [Oscillospiraceae bacterium]
MKECEIYGKLNTLSELEALIREAEEEAETIRTELKAHMTERGTNEIRAGKYRARYTKVSSSRFDSAAFKRDHADIYAAYTRLTVTHRFTIA